MKKIKWSALITMIVSLLISIVSGYCTVVGMGNVFISAASVTMFIASVIELGRVVLIYDLHHYWDKMKLYQKIPGVCMLLVAITLSAMGIFGFMSNAHSQRTQEIIPIEMEIKQKQTEIKILNDAILINNQQLNQFNNKALDKYTEMGYVTKAVNLQKEQQKITDKLYDDNRQKQNEITKLNQEILNLQLTAEQKAPTLAHLKYYAKLFNVDNDTAIIIFIVMIMTVFDTLAMYLMITSDWISKLDDEIKIINNNQINYDTNELNKIETKLNQLLDMKPIEKINNNQDIDFSPVFNAIKQDSDYQINSLKKVVNENSKITINKLNEEFIKLQNNLKDNTLIDKLTTIEENLKEVQNKSNKIEVNNIDEQLDNLINSINDNDSIIGTNSFKKYILDNPLVLDYLKDYFKNDKKVLTKLNKL
nr:MAG TPA: hypothetical protein [Caudoviricetes sp.]